MTTAEKFRLLREQTQAAKVQKSVATEALTDDAPPPPPDDSLPPPPEEDTPPPPQDDAPPLPPPEEAIPTLITRPKKKGSEQKEEKVGPRPSNVPSYLGLMVRVGKVKFEPVLKKDPYVRLKAKGKDKIKGKPIDQMVQQTRSSFQEFLFTKAEWPQESNLEFAVCTAATLGDGVLGTYSLEWPNDANGMYFRQLPILDKDKKTVLGHAEVCVVDRDMCNDPEEYNKVLRKLERLIVGETEQTGGIAKYDIGETLGEGGCGIVKRCVRKSDGKAFAVKIVKRENADEGEHEVQIMQMLNHPNCLCLEEVVETKQFLYIVMELCTGGELITFVNKKGFLSEAECIPLMRQIGSALAHCHNQGVVHRDMKPENILFETSDPSSRLKLMDFGFAKFKENTMKTCCGTPQYVAPEICKQQRYGKEVDEWSLGVIVYFILSGFLPFQNDNQALLFAEIKRGFVGFSEQHWENISPEAKAVIQGLLTVDPTKRMTVEEMLEHPWLKQK